MNNVEGYTKEQIEENIEQFIGDYEFLSGCCGANAEGNVHEGVDGGEYYGLCGKCKDHCDFEKVAVDE